MSYIAIFMLGLVAVGLIIPSFTTQSTERGTLKNKIYFSILVAIMASSPISSLAISNLLDIPMSGYSLINFAWLGFSISLPLSLAIARSGGILDYNDYWSYLEESSKVRRKTLKAIWVLLSVLLMMFGAALVYVSSAKIH